MSKLIPNKDNLCSKYATKMLSVKINNSCNCKCDFCIDRGGYAPSEINVEKMANAILDNKFDDYKTVFITGGEPFLVIDKVIGLCKLIRSKKDRIVLNTNGTLLNKKHTARLNGLIDELQISIHHFKEEKNAEVYKIKNYSFGEIKSNLLNADFKITVNSNFNNSYSIEERSEAIEKMLEICKKIGASKLRLTELKRVNDDLYVSANDFLPSDHSFLKFNDSELITKGCTYYGNINGIDISIKRLCKYAKGKNALAYSCCFIDENGTYKIDVDTAPTFAVIYSNGFVSLDWLNNNKERVKFN